MPYKNKETQRAVQRTWAARKAEEAKVRQTEPSTLGMLSLTAVRDLDELAASKTTHEELVTAAISFKGRLPNRLGLATLAIRACEISHGGARRGSNYEPDKSTLIKFAADVGVHYKTLSDWVRVKLRIVDHLPKSARHLDYSAAKYALDTQKLVPDVVGNYLRLQGRRGNPRRKALLAMKYLKAAARFFEEYGTAPLSTKELPEAKALLGQMIATVGFIGTNHPSVIVRKKATA